MFLRTVYIQGAELWWTTPSLLARTCWPLATARPLSLPRAVQRPGPATIDLSCPPTPLSPTPYRHPPLTSLSNADGFPASWPWTRCWYDGCKNRSMDTSRIKICICFKQFTCLFQILSISNMDYINKVFNFTLVVSSWKFVSSWYLTEVVTWQKGQTLFRKYASRP